MAHVPIASLARQAVLARLGDELYGFNARHSEAAAALGVAPLAVNWSDTSKQVYQSFLSPDAIEDTSPAVWPVVCVYGGALRDTGRQKYNVFSGKRDIYIDFHLTSKSAQAPRAFEPIADAVQEALVATLNSEPQWPSDDRVCYLGSPEFIPLAMTGGGNDNWRQTIRCRITLEIDSN